MTKRISDADLEKIIESKAKDLPDKYGSDVDMLQNLKNHYATTGANRKSLAPKWIVVISLVAVIVILTPILIVLLGQQNSSYMYLEEATSEIVTLVELERLIEIDALTLTLDNFIQTKCLLYRSDGKIVGYLLEYSNALQHSITIKVVLVDEFISTLERYFDGNEQEFTYKGITILTVDDVISNRTFSKFIYGDSKIYIEILPQKSTTIQDIIDKVIK